MNQVLPGKPWTDLPTARSTRTLLQVRCGVTCRASMHTSLCFQRRVQPVKPLNDPRTLQRQRLVSRPHDCSRVLPLASFFEASSSELRHSGGGGGRKKKAYLFEVEWTGEQKQQQSGQAEQTMVNRYLALLRESDVLNKLKARRRFERPRDREQRRFAERMQRIKWERQQSGFVPESLESAGGSMDNLAEPFFEYFENRAEWDKVVDHNEKTPQQREADKLGSYSVNRTGVMDLASLMPEESVAGGYLTPAAGAAAASTFDMQSIMADSYVAAASGGGYVQQQGGSDWLVPMNALVNHAANVDTDVAYWQAQLAAAFQEQHQQQQQQQEDDLYRSSTGQLPDKEAYSLPSEPTMLQQLQQSMDYAASLSGTTIPSSTSAAGFSAAASATPGLAMQDPSWLDEASDFQLTSTASHPTNTITNMQQKQQNTVANGPPPPVQQQQQQQQQQTLYSSPQVTASQQIKQQRSTLPSLPLDLAAFGWSDEPAVPDQRSSGWQQPAPIPAQQEVRQQQQQPAHLAASSGVDSATGTVQQAAVSLGTANSGAAVPTSNTAGPAAGKAVNGRRLPKQAPASDIPPDAAAARTAVMTAALASTSAAEVAPAAVPAAADVHSISNNTSRRAKASTAVKAPAAAAAGSSGSSSARDLLANPATNTRKAAQVPAADGQTSAATSTAVPLPVVSMTELVDFPTLSNLAEMAAAAATGVPAAPVTAAAKNKPRKRSNKAPTAAAGTTAEAQGPSNAADQAVEPSAASTGVIGSKNPVRRKLSMRTSKSKQGATAAAPQQGATQSPGASARSAGNSSAAAPAATNHNGVAATQQTAVSMSDIQAGFAAGEGSVHRPHDMLALQELLTDSLLLISDTTVTHGSNGSNGSNGSSPDGKHSSAISVQNGVDISSITVANGKPGSNGKRRGGIGSINKAGGSNSSSSRRNKGAQKSTREQGAPVASR